MRILITIVLLATSLYTNAGDYNYGNRHLIREVVGQFYWNEGAWIDSVKVPCDIADSTKIRILSKSTQEWKQLFLDGSDEAASALGLSFLYGVGSKQDEELGLIFLQSAAGTGRANSALHLAVASWCGIGSLTEDYIEALKWYKIAQDLDEEGLFNFDLSGIYLKAVQQATVRKDYQKAIEIHKESLTYGNTVSAVHLAAFYALGKGVDRSTNQAVEYLERISSDELMKYTQKYGDRTPARSLVAKIVVTDAAANDYKIDLMNRPKSRYNFDSDIK